MKNINMLFIFLNDNQLPAGCKAVLFDWFCPDFVDSALGYRSPVDFETQRN